MVDSSQLLAAAQMVAPAAVAFLMVVGFLTTLEIFYRRDPMPIADRVRGLRFWAIMLPLTILISAAWRGLLDLAGIGPIFSAELTFAWAGWLAVPLAALLAVIWADMFFYWFHRAQHRFLWRWHAVHHSIENLSAINSYHHWTEPLFWAVIVTLPMALIDLDFAPSAALAAFLLGAQPAYIHSNTRLNFGPLRWLLVDNRFHRIHHSTESDHFDRNFGAVTPLWDWLFGTLRIPASGEWPVVGLSEQPEPKSLRQWSAAPFNRANSNATKLLDPLVKVSPE